MLHHYRGEGQDDFDIIVNDEQRALIYAVEPPLHHRLLVVENILLG
jgi:hypothetical protein